MISKSFPPKRSMYEAFNEVIEVEVREERRVARGDALVDDGDDDNNDEEEKEEEHEDADDDNDNEDDDGVFRCCND